MHKTFFSVEILSAYYANVNNAVNTQHSSIAVLLKIKLAKKYGINLEDDIYFKYVLLQRV